MESKVAADVAARLADHVVTVVHHQGLYRHYRCQQKSRTWVDGFNIVTWPGYLAYHGDMGDYVFAREQDMIPFMANACRDHRYAALKCVASGREGITTWQQELWREWVLKWYRSSCRGMDKANRRDVKEEVDVLWNCDNEIDANLQLAELGLFDETPECYSYTYTFLWCLRAIEWTIARINEGITEQTKPSAATVIGRVIDWLQPLDNRSGG